MKLLYCFLLLFVCVEAKAQQTYSITGVITDEKDLPVPGATVFIADSRKATASDKDGSFTLMQVRPGNYSLVIKMIGYVASVSNITLRNSNLNLTVRLQEDNVMLNTVNITSMSLAERKRWLAIFIEGFLGRSNNAAQCEILNTDDIKLQFDEKTNILTANSTDFLIIENKALGYRMKYLLNNFLYDRSNFGNYLISFDGTAFFEEMTGNPRQQKRWEEERVNTYLGSVPHYFRSLFSNTLKEDGFVTYLFPNPKALDNIAKKSPMRLLKYTTPAKSLEAYIKNVDSNFKTFDLSMLKKDSTEMYILYTLKNEPGDFIVRGNVIQRPFKMPAGQLSIVRPKLDSVLISRSGDISPVTSVLLIGFWAWGQVAAFLPSDYTIPAGMEPPKVKKAPAIPAAILNK